MVSAEVGLSTAQLDDELMITTTDNPFNPKTDYDKWRIWDIDNGYNTEEYVARLIPINVDVDDEFTLSIETNKVIHEILDNDKLGIYKLV